MFALGFNQRKTFYYWQKDQRQFEWANQYLRTWHDRPLAMEYKRLMDKLKGHR